MRKSRQCALRFGPAQDGQIPRGPLFDARTVRIILVGQADQNEIAGVAGGKAGNFQVVLHQTVWFRERMILAAEKLFLIVVASVPSKQGTDVYFLAADLA